MEVSAFPFFLSALEKVHINKFARTAENREIDKGTRSAVCSEIPEWVIDLLMGEQKFWFPHKGCQVMISKCRNPTNSNSEPY